MKPLNLLASFLFLAAALPRSAAADDVYCVAEMGLDNSWTSAATWSNGKAASAGNDYFISGMRQVRSNLTDGSRTQTFWGDSLTLSGGYNGIPGSLQSDWAKNLFCMNGGYEINNLVLADGGFFAFDTPTSSYSGKPQTLSGTVNVTASDSLPAVIACDNGFNSEYRLSSNISGTGTLLVTSLYGGGGNLYIDGDNSAFTGRFVFRYSLLSVDGTGTRPLPTIQSGRSLGGNPAAFCAKAVEFDHADLYVADEADMSDVPNRGFWFESDTAIYFMSNTTLRLATTLGAASATTLAVNGRYGKRDFTLDLSQARLDGPIALAVWNGRIVFGGATTAQGTAALEFDGGGIVVPAATGGDGVVFTGGVATNATKAVRTTVGVTNVTAAARHVLFSAKGDAPTLALDSFDVAVLGENAADFIVGPVSAECVTVGGEAFVRYSVDISRDPAAETDDPHGYLDETEYIVTNAEELVEIPQEAQSVGIVFPDADTTATLACEALDLDAPDAPLAVYATDADGAKMAMEITDAFKVEETVGGIYRVAFDGEAEVGGARVRPEVVAFAESALRGSGAVVEFMVKAVPGLWYSLAESEAADGPFCALAGSERQAGGATVRLSAEISPVDAVQFFKIVAAPNKASLE